MTIRCIVFACVWISLACSAQAQFRISPADRAAGYSLDHIIVKFKTGEVARVGQDVRRFGLPRGADVVGVAFERFVYCRVPTNVRATALVAALKRNPFVEYAELDHVGTAGMTPNDTYFYLQWHHRNTIYTGGAVPSDIRSTNAWDLTTGFSNVILAILDTGIRMSEAEFAGRLVPGYDFVNNDADPSDDNGHGTAVAGTAAATGNNGSSGAGVAGVNWQCRIMPLKVLDAGNYGYYSVWARAIDWARTNGAKVINLSAGGSSSDTTLSNAIMNAITAGCIFVTITHNDGAASIRFPGRMDACITVGATSNDDDRASFSNYGPEIDLVAPGTNIYTVWYGGGYSWWWGTSFAAPQVAGVAAMLAGINTTINQAQARTLLCAGADDQVGDPAEDTPGFDNYHGWGRLNVWATLQLALNTVQTVRVENESVILSWPSPSNASNKQPYRIDHASDLIGTWTIGAVPTNMVFSATNATWTDSVATQKFYRVRVRED
ncbi:MAG: S8 family serine peptidase [bacterium]